MPKKWVNNYVQVDYCQWSKVITAEQSGHEEEPKVKIPLHAVVASVANFTGMYIFSTDHPSNQYLNRISSSSNNQLMNWVLYCTLHAGWLIGTHETEFTAFMSLSVRL